MSSDLTTPKTSFVSDVESVLKQNLEDVAVYPHWIPRQGAKLPCVTIISLKGALCMEVGIGQVVSEGVVGVLVPCRVQIDVWARSVETVRLVADQVGYALWSNREAFGDLRKGIRMSGPAWMNPGKGLSEKVYRQMLTAEAVYDMTKSVS